MVNMNLLVIVLHTEQHRVHAVGMFVGRRRSALISRRLASRHRVISATPATASLIMSRAKPPPWSISEIDID